ncbi:MAG: nuclear transport factor 2 family protein [Deltaproteobacteria bacterium]|nr:nuclear transport factor 2 family protein [Deltaproteobacteria bacterium]
MTNGIYNSFSIIHVNAYLYNKALHWTAIPLHSTAAGELESYARVEGGERNMFVYIGIFSVLLLQVFSATENLEDTLRATEQRRLDAYSDGEVDVIVEIECGAQGFGHSSSFRAGMDCESYRAAISGWFPRLEEFDIVIKDAQYKVIGNVGLVAGKLIREEKYPDNTSITRVLRYTATYYYEDDKWRMLQYHRSPIPKESSQ